MKAFDSLSSTCRAASRFAGAMALASLLALFAIDRVGAHEGHDHGAAAPPLPASVRPRVALETDLYQLVAIANGAQLTIFLDSYDANEPITDGTLSILSGSETIAVAARPDGTYIAEVPVIAKPGKHELVFNIAHKSGADLMAGTLQVEPDAASAQTAKAAPGTLLARWLPTGLALLTGLGIGIAVRTRRTAAVAVAGALVIALAATAVSAHEGHGASPVPEGGSLSGDVPRRLPDGSVFLPKPSQRLLTIRSQIALEGQANRGVSLVGRIIADPNRSGLVQSINGGRVSPPEGGLARLGQVVKQGEVLAKVEPALALADQSTLAEKQRDLEGAIGLAQQKYARLSRLGTPIVARGALEDAELEISNLQQRLASLRGAKLQPEILTAPVGGVVSTSRVVAGQVVAAQDVLFQIVDPSSLWVEALLFDQLDPGAIIDASAVASDGTVMRLAYRGRGRTLQAQAVQLQFAIEAGSARAALGQPVSVIVRHAETIRGMLVPRDAITRGPAGEAIVWHHLDPERFVARQVRSEPFDGLQVLITGGIAPKDRIVVHGAELLSQVR